MADKIVLADTSILIDFFRKTEKENSIWIRLFDAGYDFAISAVTHYEIYVGATAAQITFWKKVLLQTEVLSLDETVSTTAVAINSALKRTRRQIDMADLFIAATAVAHNLSLATLNKKHFERIDGLKLVA